MKAVRSVFLWAIGAVYFSGFLFYAIIGSYLLPPQKLDPGLKLILRLFFKILFIPVTVKGTENLQKDRIYLYMANHVSLFDIPLLGGFIPQMVRGVEADRQHKWPVYGYAMRRLGNIPIPRESIRGSMASLQKAKEKLLSGHSLIILPEGHRTMTGNMRPLKKMPFMLAKEAGVEIVPVGLSGLFSLKKKGSWHISPGPVAIKFGKPVSTDLIEKLTLEELRDHVKTEIENQIEFI